jgi:hypothetical protein
MTIMMHTHDAKSLRVRALDSESGRIKMGVTFFPLGSGSYPTPPRARVTATANIFQREVLNFMVDWTGFPTF